MTIKSQNCAQAARTVVKIPHTLTPHRLAEMAKTMTAGEFVLTTFDAVTTAAPEGNKESRQQAIGLVAFYRPDALATAQSCWAPWLRAARMGCAGQVRLRGLGYLLRTTEFQSGTGKRMKRVEVANA